MTAPSNDVGNSELVFGEATAPSRSHLNRDATGIQKRKWIYAHIYRSVRNKNPC